MGQQCVDCVRQGNAGTRQPTGRFGGRVVDRPVVTWTLVGLNVIAYLAELISQNTVINNGGMVGYGVAEGQWYRMITSAFLHQPPGSGFGLTHIIFNMWALLVVGPALEMALGRARFLIVYLCSALAGSVLFYLMAPPAAGAIGASGAIFGLFGAWFVIARRLRMDSRQVVLLIVLNLVITFLVPGIAWQGHVGGLVAGTALTAAFVYAPRSMRAVVQVSATLALLALLVVAVVIKDVNLVGTVNLTL